MISLFQAELKKATGNILLTSFTVAIIPVGLAAFMLIAFFISFISRELAISMIGTSPNNWTEAMLGVWSFLIAYPGNVLGRLLPLAYMAVLFAGEYQWGTFRLTLPRARRGSVILMKALTTSFIVLISFVIATLILGVGNALAPIFLDMDFDQSLTSQETVDFVAQYLGVMALGLLSLLILAGFAAIASILTRSILGGLLGGLGLAVVEPMSLVFLIFFARLLNAPKLVNLYQLSATYHLDNARSWITLGHPPPAPFAAFTAELPLWVSFVALIGWTVSVMALSVFLFRRQDITS